MDARKEKKVRHKGKFGDDDDDDEGLDVIDDGRDEDA